MDVGYRESARLLPRTDGTASQAQTPVSSSQSRGTAGASRRTSSCSGNRSDSENLSLETLSSPVVPCCHGYASLIATGSLGTNAPRSASLYWHAGGTCGPLGGHSALVRGTGPHLTGTAQQELEEFFTPSIERSASVATSKSPTRSAPSRGPTGSSGPYPPPHPGGICR